jgi:hypothetical protein
MTSNRYCVHLASSFVWIKQTIVVHIADCIDICTYSKFKTEFKLENYLLRLNAVHRNYICKLRTSNIKFPIETGRWMGIPRDERLCNLCNLCIGNEFQYIFCCELLKDIRTKYMPNYFIICPCEAKMNTMLKIGNTQVLTHLSLFLQKIVKLL